METIKHTDNYNWGTSVISRGLASSIDTLLSIHGDKNADAGRRKLAEMYTNDILSPLFVSKNIPLEVLTYTKIEFVKRKDNDQLTEDPEKPEILSKIEGAIIEIYGHEIFRRINVSLSKTEVNRFN